MRVSKNQMDEDKIREEKQEKLKQLQQKFLQKNKEIARNMPKNNISNNLSNVSKVKNVNVDSEEKKKLKNQLNITNKKLEELREKEKKYKDTIFKLKNNLANTSNELKNEKDNNITLSNKLNNYLIKNNEMELEIKKLQDRYYQLENSYTKKAFNIIARDVKNKDSKIISLQNHISKLNNAIKNYKEQIFTLKHGEELLQRDKKHYHKIITNYAQLNTTLNQKILKLEQEYREKIKNLVGSNLVLGQLKNDIEVAKSIKGSRNNKTKRFGTLKTINHFVFFERLNGELNHANIDEVEFKENIPCKSVIYYNKNNVALIQKVYDDKEVFIKELKESKEHKRHKNQKRKEFLYENVNYKNKYKVLIIGAENKGEYLSILKRLGLSVTFYNSYEGNVVRLKNMLDRHDIIICCLRHSRHYATNLMTYMKEKDSNNAIKYNIIDEDNTENIIARIRYCIENK